MNARSKKTKPQNSSRKSKNTKPKKKSKKMSKQLQNFRNVPRNIGPSRFANLGNDENARRFALMLTNPFDPRVEGVRQPSDYGVNTATYQMHFRTLLSTAASYSTTGAAFVIYPHPSLTIGSEGTVAAPAITFSTALNPLVAFTANPGYMYAMQPASFANMADSYRVVGGGVRLRSVESTSSTQFRVGCASLPITNTVPAWSVVEALAAGNSYGVNRECTGAIAATTNIMNAAHADAFTTYDILQNVHQGVFRPNSAAYTEFRNIPGSNNTFTSVIESDDTVSIAGVVNGASGMRDTTRMAGLNALVYQVSGGAVSRAFAELEYILHIEIVPSTSATTIPLVPTGITPAKSSNWTVEQIVNKVTAGAKLFNTIAPGLVQAREAARAASIVTGVNTLSGLLGG